TSFEHHLGCLTYKHQPLPLFLAFYRAKRFRVFSCAASTRRRVSDGWAFMCTLIVVAAVVVLLFGALYPNLVPSTLNPQWSLTIHNASSTPYTLKIMTWVTAFFAPLTVAYQTWTYWVFRQRISAERIPPPTGLARRAP
ncbi:cytochrome d ubiquinol oxidase subunit II, partial [Mycobacterium tuberculosis]